MVNGMEYVYDGRTHTKHAEIIIITWNVLLLLLSFTKFSRRYLISQPVVHSSNMSSCCYFASSEKNLTSESGSIRSRCTLFNASFID